ncbi:MAG: spermidine synthase [Victivallales bacterium]|nr:spermidine synthase [Victivallales bacterium]
MKNQLMRGWFSELSPMWPGVALSLKVEEHLHSCRSKFQQIDIFKTESCGNMLVLDGIIQATEMDEFSYQEMLSHIPLCCHPNPEKVLVIGGGDGGILREVARHDCVKSIDICEIDDEVISCAKKYLPFMACGFEDPRVSVNIADGSEFIKDNQGNYDVIIVDSSDPIGPGEALFQTSFYAGMKTALAPQGVIATQAESFFLHGKIVSNLIRDCRSLFKHAHYAFIFVPTYPGGSIGTCVASDSQDPRHPIRNLPVKVLQRLRYYNTQAHEGAFMLPENARRLFS